MYEYRIMAYFKEVEPSRSYKGKIYKTYKEAKKALSDAKKYYSSTPLWKKRLIKVVIEQRGVCEWKEMER